MRILAQNEKMKFILKLSQAYTVKFSSGVLDILKLYLAGLSQEYFLEYLPHSFRIIHKENGQNQYCAYDNVTMAVIMAKAARGHL